MGTAEEQNSRRRNLPILKKLKVFQKTL